MAQSVKTDFNVWSQFDHHAYDIMTQDFIHDTLFKVNANLLTQKGRVRLQETFNTKDDKITTTGEGNIWFPVVQNKSFYLQMKNKGFRLHFDNGLFTRNHYQHNLYASVEPSRKLDQFLFKLGCETISQNWRCNLRYRYSTFDEGHTLYSRWRYDYGNWTFEGIKAIRLNDFVPLKNNFLIGYYRQNKTYHLRLENEDWRTDPFDFKKITLKNRFDCATILQKLLMKTQDSECRLLQKLLVSLNRFPLYLKRTIQKITQPSSQKLQQITAQQFRQETKWAHMEAMSWESEFKMLALLINLVLEFRQTLIYESFYFCHFLNNLLIFVKLNIRFSIQYRRQI